MRKDEFMIVNGKVAPTSELRSGRTSFVRSVDVSVADYRRDYAATSVTIETNLCRDKSYLVTIEEREWAWGMTCEPPVPLPSGLSWQPLANAWEVRKGAVNAGRVLKGESGKYHAYLATVAGPDLQVGTGSVMPLDAFRTLASYITKGEYR